MKRRKLLACILAVPFVQVLFPKAKKLIKITRLVNANDFPSGTKWTLWLHNEHGDKMCILYKGTRIPKQMVFHPDKAFSDRGSFEEVPLKDHPDWKPTLTGHF